MKNLSGRNIVLWLLAVLPAVAAGGDQGPRPSVTARLNNNPKVSAAWKDPIQGKPVDVSNIPAVMVNGSGFKNGSARIEVFFAGQVAAEGEVNVDSGTFEALLPLKALLKDPREVTVRVGEDFSQSVQVRLRRVRGAVRLAGGSAVSFPLVTNGLYRRSDFYVTAVGDKNGNFEILVPEKISFLSIFEKNSSKEQLECVKYDAGTKDGSRLDVCMEPRLKFVPAEKAR